MKHKFDQAGDLFDDADFGIYVISPSRQAGGAGKPSGFSPDSVVANQGSSPSGGTSLAGSTVVVTTGGITVDVLFDAAAMAAPASFRAGIVQAATILSQTISDKITVNLKIDYSGTGGGAAAGPDGGYYESYSAVRSDLISHASAGDHTFNALPSGSSLQGQSNVVVWNAEAKVWGLLGANDTSTDDGSATFATDINPSLLVGVALHELTHALGRIPYGPQPDVFDIYRYTSPGTHLFAGGATAPAAYFSIDGGITKLADFGVSSDPSDFLNSGVQGPHDPFNEYYSASTSQTLSQVDLTMLDALGYHVGSGAPAPPNEITNVRLLDGVETAVISATYENSTIQVTPTGISVTTVSGFDGVTNLERLEFSDAVVAFDVNGTAGFAYRLYQAAFNRTPDLGGLSGNVHLLDTGLTDQQMAAAFVASAEFRSDYGPTMTNPQFVTALYSNVLHRAPDPSGYAGWLNFLNSGQLSRADVLIGFSESTENHSAVDPKIVTGIVLDPHYLS